MRLSCPFCPTLCAGELTKLGRRMAEFPLDPQLSKTLIASESFGVSEQVRHGGTGHRGGERGGAGARKGGQGEQDTCGGRGHAGAVGKEVQVGV